LLSRSHEALNQHLNTLNGYSLWTLVPLPASHNVVSCRWIFKTKLRSDGSIKHHKARLVAQGFFQVQGIDFDDTFSHVLRPTTIRLILSLALIFGWCLHQLDVNNAFLHGLFYDEVYMEQPPGYTNLLFPQHVCCLKQALYSLKQASRAWFHCFNFFLLQIGFISNKADSSLFVYHSTLRIIYLLLYVDDIVITGSSTSLVH